MVGEIYTIGYGTRDIDEFMRCLMNHKIDYVVDVRSVPFSSRRPEFSRDALRARLKEVGIGYAFMGDQLGGRPDDDGCYVDGRVDYAKLGKRDYYLAGIDRLRRALEHDYRLCIMCSEGHPDQCHRSKLIGQSLAERGIEVYHIGADGVVKTQNQIIEILMGGQLGLWQPLFTSNKRYTRHQPEDTE